MQFDSTDILDWWDFMNLNNILVFNLNNKILNFFVVVHDGIVFILNFETCCSSSAPAQIQWQAMFLFSDIFCKLEDHIC